MADKTAFIGACKWWADEAALHQALEQLFGYMTRRDSRVALIFFVPTKELSAVVETAREALANRDEFIEWKPSTDEAELSSRVRWPDDPQRTAVLTAFFVHLPPKPGA